jgi:NRPS condensation-like uncharacterized protein
MRQFKTTAQDWFNYVAQGVASNALIQYVIKPAQLIDYERLKKAAYNSIIAEPILGCKFIIEEPHPKWVSTSVDTQDICRLINTQNIDLEINYVVAQELNASTHIPIMIYLITDNLSNAIVIKINHAVCDGVGSKYYIKLLAENYTKIEEKNGIVNEGNSLNRDTTKFYKTLGINKLEDHFNPEKIDLTSTWGFPINRDKNGKQNFSYQFKHFEDSEFLKIKQFATKQNTTINTVLIAAYHFALLQVIQPPASPLREIQFMSDLRKYLPPDIKQTICNLSAILNVNLPTNIRNVEEMVLETDIALKKANTPENIIQGTIANDLCLQSGFSSCSDMFATEWKNILKTGNCTPMISNLGILIPEVIKFGEININDIYFVSPAFFTPAFMLGVSTYKDKLTLCASYYTPEMRHIIIKNLLEQIEYFLKNSPCM